MIKKWKSVKNYTGRMWLQFWLFYFQMLSLINHPKKKIFTRPTTAGNLQSKCSEWTLKSLENKKFVILAGLEPAIPWFVVRCLIRWATGPLLLHIDSTAETKVETSFVSKCQSPAHTAKTTSEPKEFNDDIHRAIWNFGVVSFNSDNGQKYLSDPKCLFELEQIF